MKKHLLLSFLLLVCITSNINASNKEEPKDYYTSFFGIKSDGETMNTRSIQKAIDYISENGGGRLVFHVGIYKTGSIHMKSNVTLYLRAGAVLSGSTNPYDYDCSTLNPYWQGLILADGVENVGITGQGGVIDGNGREVGYNYNDQAHKGIIKDELKNDRNDVRPCLLYIRECKNVLIEDVVMKNAAFWVQNYDQCDNLKIHKVYVDSKAYWNNDGLDIVDCTNVLVTDSYFDATDDAICFKSHDHTKMCKDIVVRNCVARSSASGIKFGTVGQGGFVNIHLSNITVYDTFRSAFTIQAVDGAITKNITVDSLKVYNTGNIIFLRIGDRWTARGTKTVSTMEDIKITNVYAELTEGKPDAGYDYEGPIEDQPRNISPCIIMGLPGHDIKNVTLKNVEIVSPGGGNRQFAYRGTSAADLDSIPEMPAKYPEFSQWKELPAWGFFNRHAENIVFENVTLKAEKIDYRPAIVNVDVKGANFKGTKFIEPGGSKNQIVSYKSSDIVK